MARENIQGPFKQVLSREATLELVPIYYICVYPEQVQQVCGVIKREISEDSDLAHLRRVVKLDVQPLRLNVMICQTTEIPLEQLQNLFPGHEILTAQASKQKPDTKEQCAEWNLKSWPILWRGNVTAILPSISTQQQANMKEWCLELQRSSVDESHATKKSKPEHSCKDSALAIFVEPATNTCVARGQSSITPTQPLGHAIMTAIEAVAQHERQKKLDGGTAGYLCSGLDLYVSYEPCAMCTMAALHSRINRLIYLEEHEQGAISMYKMHDRAQLNHTFETWRYLE